MTFNTEQIIQEIRQELEHMLDYVTGATAQTATANQIERGLFQRLLQLGAQLLTLFFVTRSQAATRTEAPLANGATVSYHSDRKRDYFSIFGKLAVWRPYFYQPGVGSCIPLDGALSLGADCYSDLVREMLEYLAVDVDYQQGTAWLARWFDLTLSTRVSQACVNADATDVEAYYAQQPAPAPDTEAAILVLQADGKGLPLIIDAASPDPRVRLGPGEKRGHKKEAIVTTVYTIAPQPRTAAEIVARLYRQPAAQPTAVARDGPLHKQIWATLDGKETALTRLAEQVQRRTGPHIHHQAALCDGCEALQSRIQTQFPTFALILDFIHANEYLWDAATALWGETSPQRLSWMETHTLQLLQSQTAAVITELRTLAAHPTTTSTQKTQLDRTANYFERNLPYMDYAAYLAHGLPIASGVIEGACRHLVKDRCERSGMRWSQPGAENLLHLRAVAQNDDWDAYHAFRRQQRHARLYDTPFPETTPEQIALAA